MPKFVLGKLLTIARSFFTSKQSKYEEFTLGEVLLLATGGRICSPLHRNQPRLALDLLAHMHGVPDVTVAEMESLARACQTAVLAQHPSLRAVVATIEAGEFDPSLETSDRLYSLIPLREFGAGQP